MDGTAGWKEEGQPCKECEGRVDIPANLSYNDRPGCAPFVRQVRRKTGMALDPLVLLVDRFQIARFDQDVYRCAS